MPINYFQYPRWDFQISQIPIAQRPKLLWLLKDETEDWVGDVEGWIRQGIIKRINRVYLYDRNCVFDHVDWGGMERFPCADKIQLLPVEQFIEYSNYESLAESLVEQIESTIQDGWDDNQPKYLDVEDLTDIPIVPFREANWATSRHVEVADYTTAEPEYEEQTIGEVIEGLIESYHGSPIWC